jgi:glucans biosynthesis protein
MSFPPLLSSTVAPDRRAVLRLGAGIGAASLIGLAPASAQQPPPLQASAVGDGQRFSQAALLDHARALARRPFVPPVPELPEPFTKLDYDQYVSIRAVPQAHLWTQEGRGFTIEPLHRGYAFNAPVLLFVVEDETVRRIAFERGKFDYGRLNVPQTLADLGFSGFRIFGDAQQDGRTREVAIFQGASLFRSAARGQNLGIMARGLTLKLGDARGEEFPGFRAFWIERPGPLADTLVVHALLDAESTTGAYRFTLRAGEMTIIDTEMTLFPRAAVENYGIGGMQSTFYFGAHSRRTTDDVRPAVHESQGLAILNGNGEWIWRPLANPETLQISSFVDPSPRGFGLLQRERDFTAFLDEDQRFERRPSLWIEPIGDWAAGSVQLFEIPTDNEINDNVIAFWRPRQPLQPGTEATFIYRQYWTWQPPERPPLAIVTATRAGRGTGGRRRRFVVDFSGDALKDPQTIQNVRPRLSVGPGAVSSPRLATHPERRLCRVAFDLDPGTENACELRLLLEAGGKPVSETWLYRWTP